MKYQIATATGASAAQAQLDGLVVNIELTLISIIQGVALSFLADNSREILVGLQLAFWPYAVTGLLVILLKSDGSMALYEAIEQEEYLRELAESLNKGAQPGLMQGLGRENPFKP